MVGHWLVKETTTGREKMSITETADDEEKCQWDREFDTQRNVSNYSSH